MTAFRFAAVAIAAALIVGPAAYAQDALTRNPAEARAGAYVLDPDHSKVTWSVSHLGFSTYIGQFSGVTGSLRIDPKAPEKAELQVTIDTASVGTLHPKLDEHLKAADFLDVQRYPKATFRSTAVKRTGERTADISGELTLHGVTRPVVVKAVFNQAGVNPVDKKYSLGFDGMATIRRSEFGMTSYLPGVGDEVSLQLEAEFKAAG